MLKTFAGSGQKVTESSEVLSTNWFSGFGIHKDASPEADFGSIYDVWWSFNYQWSAGPAFRTSYQYVVGVNMDYGVVDAVGGALYRFIHEVEQILVPVAGTVKGNDTTSLGSFDAASNMARGMEWRIQAAMEEIDRWAKGIDVPDSNWQGSAAGVFRATLKGVSNALERLRLEMINPRDFTADIDHVRFQLKTSLDALRGIHTNWLNDRMAAPVNATHDAVMEYLQGAEIGQDADLYPVVNTAHGDPKTQEFWDAVQQRAKEMWKNNVSENLDKPAGLEMGVLEGAYSSATSAIPQSLSQFHLRMPTPPGPKLPPGTGQTEIKTSPDVNGLKRSLSGQQNGGGDLGDGTSGRGVEGAGPVPRLGPIGGESGGGSLNKAMVAGLPSIHQSQGPSGGSEKIVGPNGETLTGPNNMPLMVPPGAKINSNGTVTGPDGKLLKGPNGKLLSVPRGARLSSLTEPTGGGTQPPNRLSQKLPSDFKLPSSSKVGGGAGGGGFAPSMPKKISTSSGPTEIGGGVLSERNALRNMARNSNGELVQTQTGMSARSLKAGGSLPPGEAPVMGRTNAGGTPMVPPMSGGGMGGAQGGGGGDRQRQTWLDEDEGVWGTDEGTAPGVIGR
ncbi:hypothetical protein [Streptomyces sp. NPDC088141]|uniref:hypothetical protein n=1 Tax=Streptomyces sp. NPDC088141 TaxID=3155179 RepID=UPI00341BBC5C